MCQPGPFACTLRSVGRTLQTRPGGGAMGVVGRGSLRQPRAVGPVTQRCRGDWLQGGAAWRELPLVARTGLGFPLSPHPLFRSRSLARVVWFCCWSEMVWFKDVQGCSRRKDGRGRGGWGSPPPRLCPRLGRPHPLQRGGCGLILPDSQATNGVSSWTPASLAAVSRVPPEPEHVPQSFTASALAPLPATHLVPPMRASGCLF